MAEKSTFLGKLFSFCTQKLVFFILAVGLPFQYVLADRALLLDKDKDARLARLDLIQQAKKELVLEYFSIRDDDDSLGGLALLLNAAQRGVRVRLIIDSLAHTLPRSVFAIIEKYGKDADGTQKFEVKVYNPLSLNLLKATHRDHAKILVADREQVISGGRNIGDNYFGLNRIRNFDDLDVIVEGKAAAQAHDNFLQVWNSDLVSKVPLYQYSDQKLAVDACVGEGDRKHCEFIRQAAINKIAEDMGRMARILKKIQGEQADNAKKNGGPKDWFTNRSNSIETEFISHDPDVLNSLQHAELSKRFLAFLSEAQYDVNIVSPYLIPTPQMMEVFRSLKSRGVRVRIVTNSLQSTDNLLVQAGYRSMRAELIQMGLEIYEYNGPDTVHAKTAVVDDRTAVVGTFNLDPRSAYINREVAIKMTDGNGNQLIEELTVSIEDFRRRSTLVARDGVEYNQEKQFQGISTKKKIALKVLNFLMPWIKSQL